MTMSNDETEIIQSKGMKNTYVIEKVDLTEKIQEHKKNVDRKTYSVKELAEVLGVSENKARQLTHAKDFPVLVIGAKRLTIISRLDQWLEENIGLIV